MIRSGSKLNISSSIRINKPNWPKTKRYYRNDVQYRRLKHKNKSQSIELALAKEHTPQKQFGPFKFIIYKERIDLNSMVQHIFTFFYDASNNTILQMVGILSA